MKPEEARRQAVLKFGPVEAIRESYHAEGGLPAMETILQDCRYALRSGRRKPVFGAAVVLSLALGIGAATVIFSLADTVYLRPLPYSAPDELMFVAMRIFHLEMVLSPDYVAWRKDNSAFLQLAAMLFRWNPATLGGGDPAEVRVTEVSAMRSSSAVVAPKLATSRPLLSRVGAHTQCRSLPKSRPATFCRTIGKPASCPRLFLEFAISSLPGIS